MNSKKVRKSSFHLKKKARKGSFHLKKKAQGLSLNTIIIAAIVLIVLIVLVYFFTVKFQSFGEGVEDCRSKTGEDCKAQPCSELGRGYVEISNTNCDEELGQHCCLKVL